MLNRNTTFLVFVLSSLLEKIHHLAVENASKQLTTKYRPQQPLHSSRSAVKIDPPQGNDFETDQGK